MNKNNGPQRALWLNAMLLVLHVSYSSFQADHDRRMIHLPWYMGSGAQWDAGDSTPRISLNHAFSSFADARERGVERFVREIFVDVHNCASCSGAPGYLSLLKYMMKLLACVKRFFSHSCEAATTFCSALHVRCFTHICSETENRHSS